ncbi:MAG: ATP-dependent DNA ligase LigA [Haloarculaceae archaeon]
MEFAAFADRAAAIEAEPADLEIVSLVAALFEEAGADLPIVARFVQGRVFPAHESTTLDVGPSLCYDAIARAAGQNVAADDVEDRLAETGEIGAVAASYDFGGQRGLGAFAGDSADALTVAEVDAELRALAAAAGSGSQDRKLDLLFGLFNRCDPEEARYLARIVLSEMRIGVGEGAVRDAVAEAFDVPVDAVERALQVSNDYGLVAEVAREEGERGLADLRLEVGRPVQAMLAQAGAVRDALEEWDETAVEWKYDGARVQVHYDGDDVSLYSRNMEDVTDPLPEVVEFVEANLAVPAILDGEVVAVDDDGEPLPFQEILRRFRRKHDVAKAREDVAVDLVAFDCLHVDGEDLLSAPLRERHDRLESILDDAVSELSITDDPDEIAAIEAEALEAGHEGIMLKDPASAYSPGRRGKHWLKRKPDVETLDLVVTGAEWGEGRRAEFLGTFLLSVRDGQAYQTIGKVATGITDEELAELTELLEPHVRAQDGQDVDLEPAVVFEVGYEEIQASPTYSSGYALRFPRFLGVRDDKDPADADSLERVERLAEGQ